MRSLLALCVLFAVPARAQVERTVSRVQGALRHPGEDPLRSIFDGAEPGSPAPVIAPRPMRPLPPAPKLNIDPSLPEAKVWSEGFDEVYRTLQRNLRENNDGQRHARPAPKYPGTYLWDSAFIAEVWRKWDPSVAQDVLLSVLRNQKGDGRVPQVVSILGTSDISNPPLLSWSAARVARDSKDFFFVDGVYEPLKRFHEWFQANRRHPGGLYFWKHPYESGLDNSPRFASRDEKRFDDTTKLASPDLSAYMVLDAESLAELADLLDKRDEARAFREEAAALRALIEAGLWDEEAGFYFDRNVDTGEFVKVRAISGLVPLVAGVPSPERAQRLRDFIVDPAGFHTATPFPSVARSDPAFEKDCWRGPVWVNMAYLAMLGLERYGYGDDAKSLGRALVDGVYRTYANTGKFVEYYDPDRNDLEELSRKKGNLYKRLTLGSKPVSRFVGWTGLVNTIALETLASP
ncbi:MAG: hypothetical protein HY925_04250 [Elusimicrobia bacterium]|nr:hypothetical protein [Elusimicrobiota bacterium]